VCHAVAEHGSSETGKRPAGYAPVMVRVRLRRRLQGEVRTQLGKGARVVVVRFRSATVVTPNWKFMKAVNFRTENCELLTCIFFGLTLDFIDSTYRTVLLLT